MMKPDVEKLLKQMSLVEPSQDLDARCLPVLNTPVRPCGLYLTRWRMAAVIVLSSGLGFAGGTVWPRADARPRQQLVAVDDVPALPDDDGGSPGPLVDQGFYLLNGVQPVRTYSTTTSRPIQVLDPETGQLMRVELPVRQMIIAPTPGA